MMKDKGFKKWCRIYSLDKKDFANRVLWEKRGDKEFKNCVLRGLFNDSLTISQVNAILSY